MSDPIRVPLKNGIGGQIVGEAILKKGYSEGIYHIELLNEDGDLMGIGLSHFPAKAIGRNAEESSIIPD